MSDDQDQAQPEPAPDPDRDPVEDLAEAPWTDWRAVAARLVPYPPDDLELGELQPWPAGSQETDDAAAGRGLESGDEEVTGDPAGGTAGEDGGG